MSPRGARRSTAHLELQMVPARDLRKATVPSLRATTCVDRPVGPRHVVGPDDDAPAVAALHGIRPQLGLRAEVGTLHIGRFGFLPW